MTTETNEEIPTLDFTASTAEPISFEIEQSPGGALGEHETIAALRSLGLIAQPAHAVDHYAPGAEAIVEAARNFFQSHRSVQCRFVVVHKA